MTVSPRTGLVTAAAGRIGAATVDALLAAGLVDSVLAADVVAVPERPGVIPVVADLFDPGAPATIAAALEGDLDVLVNVLGGERRPAVAEVPEVAWPPTAVFDDIVDLNLGTAYRLTRALRDRLAPGAAICNVSSIAADLPWTVSPAYGAAKAALEHWSKTLAAELADRGIRVNAVRPGFVWSEQWAAVDRAEFDAVAADRIPLRQFAPDGAVVGREQSAADVAGVAAFLCSPAAGHLTGQMLDVDGGAALLGNPR